jgi:glycerate-2-kinase
MSAIPLHAKLVLDPHRAHVLSDRRVIEARQLRCAAVGKCLGTAARDTEPAIAVLVLGSELRVTVSGGRRIGSSHEQTLFTSLVYVPLASFPAS